MALEPEASEVRFSGPIFSVARERWPGLAHEHDVVRHLGAAAVLPITPGGDALLVRQFRPAIRQELVEIPAGLLDRPGEDALSCAARELVEETGFRHASIEFLGGVYPAAGFSNEYVHLFWSRTEAEPVGPSEPGIELVTLPLAELIARARAGRVRDAKTALAALLMQGRTGRSSEPVG
jgi:ADP-ribose pyrophosphatase